MALRVEQGSPSTTRGPVLRWVAALLPAALGITWAIVVAMDGMRLLDVPEDADAGPLLLLWAGYAFLASLLYSVLVRWRPRLWVTTSLLASAVIAGIAVRAHVDSAIPTPEGSGWGGGHPNEVWGLVLWHTGLGLVFVLVLSGLALAVLWRDHGTAHLGSAIGIVASIATGAHVLFMAPLEQRALPEIPFTELRLPLVSMAVTLFFAASMAAGFGLRASIRERHVLGITLSSVLLVPFGLVVLVACQLIVSWAII